jgi:hypothetical protein
MIYLFLKYLNYINYINYLYYQTIISVLSIACKYSFNPNPKLLAVYKCVLHFLNKDIY